MNQTRYYVSVGIALAVALALLVAFLAFLRGTLTDYRTYEFFAEFQDARGITTGAPVQMAGVEIGRVTDVSLTPRNTARLRLRVEKRYTIPQDASFTIVSALLGGAATVRVDPTTAAAGEAVAEGATITGDVTPSLETAFAKSERLLESFQRTATAVERVVTDPRTQRDLTETLRNVRAATEGLPALSRRVEAELALLSARTNRLLANLETASVTGNRVARNAEGITTDLRAAVNENRGTIRSLLENADANVAALRVVTESLGETLEGGEIQQNLIAATDNLASLSARLDSIAGDLQRLSSDPRLASDIRETVTNLRESSESVKSLAARIEGIRFPGERRPGGAGGGTPRPHGQASFLELGPTLDGVYEAKPERLRVDANFTLLGTGGRFYRAGIHDVTESNRLNLQIGQTEGNRALRYGLIAGKFGGGLDLRAGPVDLRFDLFDPNRLTLNVRAKARLGAETNALLGVDSVGGDNRAVIGVQIRR